MRKLLRYWYYFRLGVAVEAMPVGMTLGRATWTGNAVRWDCEMDTDVSATADTALGAIRMAMDAVEGLPDE